MMKNIPTLSVCWAKIFTVVSPTYIIGLMFFCLVNPMILKHAGPDLYSNASLSSAAIF